MENVIGIAILAIILFMLTRLNRFRPLPNAPFTLYAERHDGTLNLIAEHENDHEIEETAEDWLGETTWRGEQKWASVVIIDKHGHRQRFSDPEKDVVIR